MKNTWMGAAVLLLACGGRGDQAGGAGKQEMPRSEPAGAQPAGVSPRGATLEGRVSFTGAAPANRPIDMSEEPTCKGKYSTPPLDPVVVVKDGGLANVLVYVKSGLPEGQKYEAPKEPVVLDQEACLYHPRTLGVMVNQEIAIRNSDSVLHNVKALAKKNRPFNISQPQAGMETIRTFSVEELPIQVECNVHGWMRGNIGVLTHPFFAVSGPTGDFAIQGLPAGTYTVEAWHEQLGTKTGTATVATDGKTTVAFSYGAS